MMLAQAPDCKAEFEFSQREFQVIAKLVHSEFGLHIPPEKKPLVYARVIKRIRALPMESFAQYCSFVQSGAGHSELGRMLSALTTNVSHFFREPHHFEILEREVLPALIARARAGGRVRLWSAGCSAGQEPYSIAFSVLKICPEACKLDIRILATDVDNDVLTQARRGWYNQSKISDIGPEYLDFVTRSHDGCEVLARAKTLVAFTKLNLAGAWPQTSHFDAIFCRNVAIYFDQNTQAQLWSKFSARLGPDGVLFIGHSERLTETTAREFQQIGITAFAKNRVPTQNGATQ